jgi:hypothetical protein
MKVDEWIKVKLDDGKQEKWMREEEEEEEKMTDGLIIVCLSKAITTHTPSQVHTST